MVEGFLDVQLVVEGFLDVNIGIQANSAAFHAQPYLSQHFLQKISGFLSGRKME